VTTSFTIASATPVLRVADVAKSIAFYRDTLGFTGDPFPEKPPYEFAILRRG
jgi:catechol 2,3-dioxygenase-like lactoylglutathione lyase family enzyme